MATQSEWDATDPRAAVEKLRSALSAAGIVFPSLGTDAASGMGLVDLGRIRPDVAIRLAETLRKGSES